MSRHRVLIVDDDDAIRLMVERVLRRESYEVDSARDGFEAIEKLRTNDYETILLDLMMPRVDGHGVLRYLEGRRTSRDPRVIVMTANLAGLAELQRAADAILPKPFDITQLVENIRSANHVPICPESGPLLAV